MYTLLLYLSSSNLLFLGLLFLGPVISISSTSWVICWIGVELSFLGFIPLMFFNNKYSSMSKESTMKYFCIQALGSALMFYSGMMVFFNASSNFSYIIFLLSIFMKLGIFPMHFWVQSVVAGLDFFSLFFLMSVQKIAPFAFLSLLLNNVHSDFNIALGIFGAMTALIGSVLGNNQTDMRSMLGCSSIAHSGWLVLSCMSGYLWEYFFIYCLTLLLVLVLLLNLDSSIEAGVGILSLSGLPPFPLFLGKWGVLKSSLECSFPAWLISFFMVSALFSLGFYLKFSYSFLLNNLLLIWNKYNNMLMIFLLLMSTFLLLLFFMI